MAYNKFRFQNTDVHVYEQEENEFPRLLQANKLYPLSEFYVEDGVVSVITNCSYFTTSYVLGRNQGDLYNNTHDQDGFYDLVLLKDGTYKLGQFKSWDYTENVLAGFSVATVLIQDGKDTDLVSEAIENVYKITNRNPQTAIAYHNGKYMLIVSDGRSSNNVGLSGSELRDFIKTNYPNTELLCQLDGGGSSEMIVDGSIVNKPSDGVERKMFNGLAFIKDKQEDKEIEIQYPCADGWVSQDFHSGHMAIDFGWLIAESSDGKTPIYACADGVVEVADYYEEVVSGKKVKPIVCILRHDDLDPNYTYYSAYWHLASTPKNTGDVVKVGEQIGIKGNTGYSGGVHLHFVLMKCPRGTKCPTSYEFNKYAINPLPFMYRVEGQVFDGKGVYDIPLVEVNTEPPVVEKPCEECEILKEENELLQAQVEALEKEKEELISKLKSINDISKDYA